MTPAEAITALFTVYGSAGLLFAVAFVTRGLSRVDPQTRGASWFFRLLLLPGAAAFWPWLLLRWRRS